MNRGEIYLVSLDPAKGKEQYGTRPVLIISSSEFNNATNTAIILPITNGGAYCKKIGFAIEIIGIKTTGYIRCDQPRVLDIKSRNGKKIDTLPTSILEDALARTITIFL